MTLKLKALKSMAGFFISCAFLFMAFTAQASSNKIRYIKAYGKRYVYLRDVANFYGMKYFAWKEKCGIYSRYSRIEFTYDKKEGRLNGTKVHFLHSPFLKGFDAFISEQDFLLVVDPILRKNALPFHRVRVVMIDPGHGGEDMGGHGKFYEEKSIVLRVAYKLRNILKKKGYQVIMTRDRDKFIPLNQRAEETLKKHADIFVSIHANIAGKSYVSGVETFCATPQGAASTHDSKPSNQPQSGNSFDKNNGRLAYEIQKAVIGKTKANDRGVKRARFVVIRESHCPAALVEIGFLSNPREERALGRNSYQQTIANAIAEGIINYNKALMKK